MNRPFSTMKQVFRLPDTDPAAPFPPVHLALDEPNGLLAVGGDLSPERLLAAYRAGVFPWFEEDQPILWWSPDPRALLFPETLTVRRSLRKRIRNGGFTVTFDRVFPQVIDACAAPRGGQHGTWITRGMKRAYTELYDRGYAHSVEAWHDGRLAGGLYGVAMGRAFFGESMFSRVADSSKVALVYLVGQLADWGYHFVDAQVPSPHLARMGARNVSRTDFVARLGRALAAPAPENVGPWHFDPGFDPLCQAEKRP